MQEYEKQIDRNDDTQQNSFEKSLIRVLTNLELILTSLLENKRNGGSKHE